MDQLKLNGIEVECIIGDQPEEREREQRLLVDVVLDILGEYEFIKVVGCAENRKYVGIVSCLIDGISSDSVGTIFDDQGISVRTGLQCAPLVHKFIKTFPAGTVRFSVGYFTSEKDYEELREALDYINSEI